MKRRHISIAAVAALAAGIAASPAALAQALSLIHISEPTRPY